VQKSIIFAVLEIVFGTPCPQAGTESGLKGVLRNASEGVNY
jgi:hypothetical protein